MDSKNKKTFGNLTVASGEAYGYNLETSTGYNNARVMGFQNYKKLQDLASIYYDKKGLTFGRWLDISFTKMMTSTIPFGGQRLVRSWDIETENPLIHKW